MKYRHYVWGMIFISSASFSSITFDTEQGALKLYGDVEFNLDGASRTGQITSLKTRADKNWKAGEAERWDVNGRILIGLDGYRSMADQSFAGFTVQPLADLSGGLELDDAAFFFGQEKDWKVQVGRYEAFDMFPLNQDTLIEYSGNTANDLYEDGYGYIYMMKEARGRGSAGAVQLSKTWQRFYFELNAMANDGTKLFQNGEYHGNTLEHKKNVIYLRPVIAWRHSDVTAAVGMESNVVNNAYGYTDNRGQFKDQSKRNGYGATLSWDGQRANPDSGTVINLSTAYMDATEEQNFSAGLNGLWRDFQLGYIYARNDVKAFTMQYISGASLSDFILGKYDLHTIHSSYRFRNVMKMQNFDIYLGAYWSQINAERHSGDSERYGARVRFKYHF